MTVWIKMLIFALVKIHQMYNYMDMITSLLELEKAFRIETLSKITNYDIFFKALAESLFNNFQIRNGNDIFRFVEI